MSDTESMSSDNSDNELFTEEFLENIPEDSDSSDNKNNESYFNNTSYNTELNSTLRLEVGLTFLTWKAAFEYIKKWAHEQGFYGYTRMIQRIIKLNHQKHIDLAANDLLACRFDADKAFTKPMLEDIEWMCLYGQLKPLEIKHQLGNDVSRLLVHLEKCKDYDCRWIIFKDWDHETNTLTKIFWMTPNQIEAWCQFSDVIINDNTAKTNCYEMALSFFVAIDSNMKS
ncbi:hypothetical protein RhiirC2_771903 [Rhizophagus irregularis]|uniref:Uncharacterized protein n=1 Tax=Rhizophagus irregularis TaxID=588596 RepID=A0A2N1NSU3_9GLOM|nr:hypothetical protein RhiirC2_771903 [Rhizophagus irregularis]